MEDREIGKNNRDSIYTYGDESLAYEMRDAQHQQSPYGSQQNVQGAPCQQTPYGSQQNVQGAPCQQGPYGSQQNVQGAPRQQGPYGSQTLYSSQQNAGAWQNINGAPPNYNWQNHSQPQDPYLRQMSCPPQPQHGPVSDMFCHILLVLLPLRILLGFFSISGRMSQISYHSIVNGNFLQAYHTPGYMVFTVAGYALTVATLICFVADIVKIHRQNYKITGLILFALLLNPGYYLWRAYILGRQKTVPVIYTVVYSLMLLAYMAYTFYTVFRITMGILYGI